MHSHFTFTIGLMAAQHGEKGDQTEMCWKNKIVWDFYDRTANGSRALKNPLDVEHGHTVTRTVSVVQRTMVQDRSRPIYH